MPYSLTKAQRALLILSVAFLVLEYLYVSSISWLMPSFRPEINRLVLLKVVHVMAYGQLMLTLFRYFRHYKLKVLMVTTLVVALTEVINTAFFTIRSVQQVTIQNMAQFDQVLVMTNSVVLNMALITWFIFLFLASRITYPGLFSIQKYAIGMVVIALMGLLMPLLFHQDYFATGFRLINLTVALNYLFLLEFVLKVPQREEVHRVSQS